MGPRSTATIHSTNSSPQKPPKKNPHRHKNAHINLPSTHPNLPPTPLPPQKISHSQFRQSNRNTNHLEELPPTTIRRELLLMTQVPLNHYVASQKCKSCKNPRRETLNKTGAKKGSGPRLVLVRYLERRHSVRSFPRQSSIRTASSALQRLHAGMVRAPLHGMESVHWRGTERERPD